jgi:hypothetical protein
MAQSDGNVLRFPDPAGWGATFIGIDRDTGERVYIPAQAHSQGLIDLIGVSGTGKTTLLHHLIQADLEAGRGLALVEPHGDLVRSVIATMPEQRIPDVVLLDLLSCGEEAFGLNIFERPTPYTPTEIAKQASLVFRIFETVWGLSAATPNLGMSLRHVTRTLIENRATFAEILLLLQDEAVRERMVRRVKNPHTRAFFEAYERRSAKDKLDLVGSLLNRVDAYMQEGIAPILSQERSTVGFRQVMDSGKVLLVLLSPQLAEMSRLIGTMVVAGILRAAFSRADTPEDKRRPFSLYIDEFQRFMTDDTATLIHESRKFRLSPICLAHQALGQLTAANRAAVAAASTRIVFRVSPEDAKVLAPSFNRQPKSERVGDEPVRAPVADVLGHLVHKGHHHPVVAQFTADFLLPLDALLRTLGSAMHPMHLGEAMFGPVHAAQARLAVNECLSEANRTGRADLPIDPLALFMLGVSASEKIPKVFSRYFNSMALTGGFFNGFDESTSILGKPSLLTNRALLSEFLAMHDLGFWEKLFGRQGVTPGEAFVRMLRALRTVLSILSKEPLTTDTGVYKSRMQQRLYSDVEGEIANELSATLRNYQAKVRLVSGEHTIQTFPAPKGLTGRALAERIERIKRQMRFLGVTKTISEINEEVRKRQDRLRGG